MATILAFTHLPAGFLSSVLVLCACFHGFVRTGYAFLSKLPQICVTGQANAFQQNARGRKESKVSCKTALEELQGSQTRC